MAAVGNGPASYDGAGAGGKFRKKPFRRSQTTPYDRPSIALRNPSIGGTNGLLSRILDPATKLIYAGAHRLFGVFRYRLTLPPPERPPEANQGQNDGLGKVVIDLEDCTRTPEHRNNQNGNSVNTSGATEITEIEKMLTQRSFTRSEMERLKELLHSRTSDLPVENEDKRVEPKLQFSLLNQNRNGDDIFRASVATPVTSSMVNEDIASPADLAKAYMGTKVPPLMWGSHTHESRDYSPSHNGSVFPKSPISLQLSLASKATKGVGIPQNGFTTPRSRGRSAIYSMARTPNLRIYSTDTQKGIVSYGGPSSSSTPSMSAREQEGPVGSKQMALKRRSFVLEDDIGSVGTVRRTRQKPNLLSHGGFLSAKPLTNEPEHKVHTPVERIGDTAKPLSRYDSVPTESSKTVTKIFQQLEMLSPKEKPSQFKGDPAERKPSTRLTPTMLHGQALRSMDMLDSSKFLNNVQEAHKSDKVVVPDVRDSTVQKDKVEENVSKMFAVPRNLLTPVISDATVSVSDTGGSDKNAESFFKIATEPPQKKRAFQMSAHEDFLEMDDEIHSNEDASKPVVEKDEILKTSVFTSNDVSPSKSLTLPESNTAASSVSIQRADFGILNGSVFVGEKTDLSFSSLPTNNTTYQPSILTESTSTVDKFTPPKETDAFPSSTISTKTIDKGQPFAFTSSVFGIESSGTKTNSWSDVNPESSSSLVNVASVSTNGQVKVPVFDKSDNNSTQNTVNGIRKSDILPSAESDALKSGIFPFGIISAKNSDLNNHVKATDAIGSGNSDLNNNQKATDLNGTLASNPSSSLSTASVSTSSNFSNQFFNKSSHSGSSTVSSLPSSGITSGATTSSGLSTSVSLASTSDLAVSKTSVAETTDTKTKNDLGSSFGNNTTSPFGVPFSGTGSLFKFNSSATPSTAMNPQSQGSLFSTGSGSLTNTQATTASSTQSAPFQFVSTSLSVFGTLGSTSSTPVISPLAKPFSSTSASFGQSSSDAISGWQPAKTSVSGSTFSSSPSSTGFSFGLSSTSVASTSSAPSMVFGSTTTTGASSGSPFSFGAYVSTTPSFPTFSQTQSVFGNSNPTFPATSGNGNNDQMGMEDSMAEDPMNSPSPPAFGQPPSPVPPAFGQQPSSPGFIFSNTTSTTTPALQGGVLFQFGGQQNVGAPQNNNPFQSSSSLSGSFSLGSGGGGGDKSGRRMVRISKNKNRKK